MSVWKWWIAIAATALVVGGVAWLLKLWVIVATDGRVVATGAAGAFLDLGLLAARRSSCGVPVRVPRFVRYLFAHRVRTGSYWARHRRRRAAQLPARRRRDLHLSGGRDRSRDMARTRGGSARSPPQQYRWRFGNPASRAPTAGTLSARPTCRWLPHPHRSSKCNALPGLRLSATLGEEPEVEVALV